MNPKQLTATKGAIVSEEPLNSRLLIVSNRLPVVLDQSETGDWLVQPGSGGLVTAMAPVLKHRGGIWIGWAGTVAEGGNTLENVLAAKTQKFGYTLKPVHLTSDEKEKYYEGFANEIIWPLFHDFTSHCNFRPEYWLAYQRVNQKFAGAITQNMRHNDFIWVHDYHLMTVARELHAMGVTSKIAFFLHIPFPPLDILVRLPWRFEILHALLEYDLIGFQTFRDRRNFVHCVRTLLKGLRIEGRGQVNSMRLDNREIRVGVFPNSIDFREFAKSAATQEVSDRAWYIHEDIPKQKIILGVDRLDYTKGIPERLEAYRSALKKFPELQENTTLIQVVVPSRRSIPKYASLKTEIERLVGEINGQFTRSGWVPIHYIFRSLERPELLAYYRTAEIALITPLKDGMNLVAKEYCACCLENTGVLIMSEFAGAAAQLQKYALLVNPHDIEGIAEAIYRAFKMDSDETKWRMRRLRQIIRKYDIFWWVDSFLTTAFAKDLSAFPLLQDYVPEENVAMPIPSQVKLEHQ
ncbi:MAG: trehalose-6-phosphate synthase [bacterium]